MEINVLETTFWEKSWREFREKITPSDTRANDQAKKWNKRAESFFRRTSGSYGNKRTEQVFNYLQQSIELKEGRSVLDIGCGPGSFAIPFAEVGMQVTALDPAEKMLGILQENLPEEFASRVNTIKGLWELIDSEKLGWKKKFDLVFASMSPGIRDKDTLEKMIFCSKKLCFLSSFAGPRHISLYEELWPIILGKTFKNHVNDIIFPFNMLYSMGYKPSIQFVDASHLREDTLEDAAEDIKNMIIFEEGKFTDEQEEKIHNFLAEREVDGKVPVKINSTVGMIVWRVD